MLQDKAHSHNHRTQDTKPSQLCLRMNKKAPTSRHRNRKMDPLSLLASIAGVSTAGIALSKAIYDLISSIRSTPKEISDIARGISDLSLILRELRRVLKDGRKLYTRKLLRRVNSAVRRIQRIHEIIGGLIGNDGMEGLVRLKWLFRRSRTMHLLYQIESHKTGINMILRIMILAVQTRKISMYVPVFYPV